VISARTLTKYCQLLTHQHLPISDSTFRAIRVGVKEVEDGIWLVSFMDYDLGYIDLEERTLQPLENPFGPKVLPMS
jgi:hypothetical protein